MSVCMGCLTNKRVHVGVCVCTQAAPAAQGGTGAAVGDTLSLLSLAACAGRVLALRPGHGTGFTGAGRFGASVSCV